MVSTPSMRRLPPKMGAEMQHRSSSSRMRCSAPNSSTTLCSRRHKAVLVVPSYSSPISIPRESRAAAARLFVPTCLCSSTPSPLVSRTTVEELPRMVFRYSMTGMAQASSSLFCCMTWVRALCSRHVLFLASFVPKKGRQRFHDSRTRGRTRPSAAA